MSGLLSSEKPSAIGRKTRLISFLVFLACSIFFFNTATAQPDKSLIESVEIGFAGKIILGKWLPFTVRLAAQSEIARLQVDSLDGDAVPVRFTPDLDNSNAGGLIRIGRASGITIHILDSQGDVIESRRFSLDELRTTHTFLPGTTRLTLYLGLTSAEQLEPVKLERHLSDEAAVVTDYRLLPESWIGYESVRTVVIIPDELPPGIITKEQLEGLDQWIRTGGRALITGGKSSDVFFGEDTPPGFLPGTFTKTELIDDTGSIELFTGSNEQLVRTNGPKLPVTVIETRSDAISDGTAGNYPLVVRWMHGFGKISFVSLDFTCEPLASWDGRKRLLTLALDDAGNQSGVTITEQTGRVSHIGFTDMVGQLRAAMDQFKRVSFITFTLVALLIGLFILAIGPGDYFFLRKFSGRMEMTWVTFSLICLAFCLVAWLLASRLKSSETELNQVEIIDIDTVTGQVRGSLWTHIYSPGTETYDVAMPGRNELFGELKEGWITWQGLPGRGLGSMQSKTDLGLYRRRYDCNVDQKGSQLDSVPMQNASTKTLFGTWTGTVSSDIRRGLRQSANSDALLGTVTNPLDHPLYECLVLYGDWVYVLPDRPLDAGETIVIEDDLREKTIKGHFTRLGGRGEDEVSSAWDPASTRLPRIVQMMSFFDAIGGETYTRLTNDFHPTIDFSHQLQMGRAVLVGQIRQATTPLSVNGQPFTNYDRRFSLIRIVLSVEPRK